MMCLLFGEDPALRRFIHGSGFIVDDEDLEWLRFVQEPQF